jgi:threonine aldolase
MLSGAIKNESEEVMIDLRSDTVTVPTEEMRKFMSEAPVGDDVYGEDPSVNELQQYIADLLGKDAAIYVPSGVMANQLAIATQTSSGDEIIVEGESHIFLYETGAPALISRVQLKCIPSETGAMDPDEILKAIRPDVYYHPKTSLICLENTHNNHGGTILSLEYINNISAIAKKNKIRLHCDGARLWNASAETGISLIDYATPFNSVSICLSKGLGAPVGSVLAGDRQMIEKARKLRKMLGGGMRQSGILAAAGLFAINNHFKLLAETHDNARLFSKSLLQSGHFTLDLEKVQTNIVIFDIIDNLDMDKLLKSCKDQGLLISALNEKSIRAVFHFQVSRGDSARAAVILKDSARDLLREIQ